MRDITLERFHTQTRFQLNRIFMRKAISFVSITKQIYAKPFTVSENTFEIKAMSPWTLLDILLKSAVTCKQRLLHENYKCQEVIQDHILESPYKVLQTPLKKTTLTQSIQFSWAVQFLATFYVWIFIIFVLFKKNQSNNIF